MQRAAAEFRDRPSTFLACRVDVHCTRYQPSYQIQLLGHLRVDRRTLLPAIQTAKMVNISEVKGNARDNRTAAHTHIKGLGLRPDGTAETSGNGFVGQTAAREVENTSASRRTDG